MNSLIAPVPCHERRSEIGGLMSAQIMNRVRFAIFAVIAAGVAASGCATVPAVIFAGLAGVEDKASLDGSWEIQFTVTGEGQWTDPTSSIAQRMQFWGNPMGGDPSNGMRTFATFDAKNVFIGTYSYDQANNKLYVDTPNGNPFMGKMLTEQSDGTFSIVSTQFKAGDNNSPLQSNMSASLVLGPNESGGWNGQIVFSLSFTAVASMPEDVANNLPAINPGDTATFTVHWELALSPSDPPVILFPDAEWTLSGD